jgi:single-strand DNA-binding protein
MNKVILLGRIEQTPEYTEMKGDTKLCKISIATNRRSKNKEGEWSDVTDWHDVTLWNALAKRAVEHGRKGREVYLEGRLQKDSWEKDGKKHTKLSIVGNEMKLLGSGNNSTQPVSDDSEPTGFEGMSNDEDDDIPF